MSTPVLNKAAVNENARILGIGAYRPDVIVTNEDVCQWIDSSDEWIRQRTGIITRHRAAADVSVIDMAEGAAREALAASRHRSLPAGRGHRLHRDAPLRDAVRCRRLADRLGATPAPAFDISAACAGYCYGVAQADALVRSGAAQYVLVVGAEKLSDVIDNHERTISFLLGDGAGAVVVGPSDTPGIGPSVWGSDGSKWDAIGMTHSLRTSAKLGESAAALRRNRRSRHAVGNPGCLAHPAPGRPDRLPLGRLGDGQGCPAGSGRRRHRSRATSLPSFPTRQTCASSTRWSRSSSFPNPLSSARDIAQAGNTSAASIPLATHRLLQENPELSGGLALQIGFGAGLVFGAQVVVLP